MSKREDAALFEECRQTFAAFVGVVFFAGDRFTTTFRMGDLLLLAGRRTLLFDGFGGGAGHQPPSSSRMRCLMTY